MRWPHLALVLALSAVACPAGPPRAPADAMAGSAPPAGLPEEPGRAPTPESLMGQFESDLVHLGAEMGRGECAVFQRPVNRKVIQGFRRSGPDEFRATVDGKDLAVKVTAAEVRPVTADFHPYEGRVAYACGNRNGTARYVYGARSGRWLPYEPVR